MRGIGLLVLVGTVLAGACVSAQVVQTRAQNQGTYVDGSQQQHIWSINNAHGMMWKSEPFIPVGGLFESKYLNNPTDENLQADQAALTSIKSAGITDIVLSAGKPLTDSTPAALQKIIDYLDGNGFTYGIDINDGPRTPLSGYLISPNLYRLAGPSQETVITKRWPNVDSAIWIIVSKYDFKITQIGGALVNAGNVTIRLPQALSESEILIVYPHVVMPLTEISDVWGSYDEYRDKLLKFFETVKLGPGLRFVRDPIVCKLQSAGDLTSFLPDSPRFRVGFEADLGRKYGNSGSLNAGWGLLEPVDDIETATRLMPMWNGTRGMAVAYDVASAKMYSASPAGSRTWADIADYRTRSLQEKLMAIADAFKKSVANVPVIYSVPSYNSAFCSPFAVGGFDGLAPDGRGLGEEPVKNGAGVAWTLAEESAKTMWFVAGAANASSPERSQQAYSGEGSLVGSLEMLQELGCKGFYVDALQSASSSGYSLAGQPEQLAWLAKFRAKLAPAKDVEYTPTVISFPFYPETGARITRLLPGTWWLPTQRAGRVSHIGDGMGSYTILTADWSCFWSGIGPVTLSFPKSVTGYPTVAFPPGAEIKKKKGGGFSAELTSTPLVLKGVDFTALFPVETANAEINKLAKLIPEADKRGLEVGSARKLLERVKEVVKNSTLVAYDMAHTTISDLLGRMGGDTWLEGENCDLQSFGGPSAFAGASNSQVLLLDTDQDAPLSPYTATFTFQNHSNASYDLWIASTPPGIASPISYTVDDTSWQPLKAVDGNEQAYTDGLTWYKFATVNLTPMKHVLRFRADGKETGGRYKFAVDALMITARGIRPNGVIVPF